MVVPRGSQAEACVWRGNITLMMVVETPCNDRSISPDAQAMTPRCRDRDKVGVRGWHIALAIVVVSPCLQGSIVPKGEIVKPSCRNCDETRIRGRNVAWIAAIAPGGN